jgi:hypothetical protein
MMNQLGLNRESWNERNMGLPVYVGRWNVKTFSYLKDRIWQRIQGWKGMMREGKEFFIKSNCTSDSKLFHVHV